MAQSKPVVTALMENLYDIYRDIAVSKFVDNNEAIFVSRSIPEYSSYFVGRDSNGNACLLVETSDGRPSTNPPIKLEILNVLFDLRCEVEGSKEDKRSGDFTVIRCESEDQATVGYFFSVCRVFIDHLGDSPA